MLVFQGNEGDYVVDSGNANFLKEPHSNDLTDSGINYTLEYEVGKLRRIIVV